MSALLTAGVDVGTASVKAAVVRNEDGGTTLVAHHVERLHRRDPAAVAGIAFARVLKEAGLDRGAIAYVASTGEGEALSFRDGHFYGMTTHARGARFLDASAKAVADLGALHARALTMDERCRVVRQRMTSQCASGTGQFVENIARYLGVRLEEIGPLSLEASRAEVCSGICAVLAETDVINMVSRGIPIGEILRGIHESIALRVVKLLRTVGAESPVLLTGGLAQDTGLRTAIERRLLEEGRAIEVRAHQLSIQAGAIGAALWGAHRHAQLAASRVAQTQDGASIG